MSHPAFERLDPAIGERVEALLERLLTPHPDEEIVGWIAVRP